MKNFYEKLKAMDPEKFIMLEWIVGVIAGIICWLALRAGSFLDDQLLQWAFVIVFAVIMLGSNKIAKETGLNLSKFRIAMAVGLGACIAVFAITYFCFGQKSGLIEMIFNITPRG